LRNPQRRHRRQGRSKRSPLSTQDSSQDSGPRTQDSNVTDLDERRRTKSSPLVRKIAAENNVDITQIQGSGVSGRVTKTDILGYLENPQPAAAAPAQQSAPRPAPAPTPSFPPGENARIEPL